jgi:hypothetical protein
MLSELAIGDMDDLAAKGILLSPAEVVRLNELGLRCERGAHSADFMATPRIGWAGNIAIHEPTPQVEEWMSDYAARFATDDDSYASMLLFACAHARTGGFFDRAEMQSPRGIRAEMQRWRKNISSATARQLAAALDYAVYGADAGVDVVPVAPPPGKEKPKQPVLSAVDEAIAAGLSLSLSELRTLASSRLYTILDQHYRNAGCEENKQCSVKAHAEYTRTLAVIVSAHEKDLSNG